MRYLFQMILVLSLLANSAQSGAADLATGLAAYERQDYQAALGQLMQLAEAGDPDAQFIMGRMFGRGEGVLQDYIEAYKWYNLAASRGQRLAAAARDSVAAKMTPGQVAEAQELARAWRPLGRANLPSSTTSTTGFATNDNTNPNDTVITTSPSSAAPSSSNVIDQSGQPATVTKPTSEDSSEEELSETLIANIQLELKRLGYPIPSVDGRLSGQTVVSIQAYQRNNRLKLTGTASRHLLEHLRAQHGDLPSIRRAPPAQVRERPLPE